MFVLILGPMKSGKTLELIARVAPYEFADQRVLYVQSAHNVRDDGICSRLGLNTKAIRVNSLTEIKQDFDVMGVDESLMFPTSDLPLIEKWLAQGKTLFFSSLDLDYRAKMPEIIKDLVELKPDQIIYKTAVCDVCKQYDARFSQILHNGELVLEGLPTVTPEDGTYEYQARCRKCFVKK